MPMKPFHRFLIVSVFIIGCITTYYAYSFSGNLAINDAKQKFNDISTVRISEIEEKLQDTQDILLALKAFFDSSDDVTEDDFSSFSTVLTKHQPQLSILAWLEKVSATDSDLDKSSGFQYRVRYSHLNNNDDLNSLLIADESLVSTTVPNDDTNLISMTVLEPKYENNLVRFSLPIFSKARLDFSEEKPIGFLVIIVDLSLLITSTANALPFELTTISIKNNDQILAFVNTTGISSSAGKFNVHSSNLLKASKIINIAGNSLEINSSSKLELFYNHTYLSKLTLALGIMTTLLLSYIVYISLRRHLHVIELVEKKTDDLMHAKKLISKQEKQLESKVKKYHIIAELQHALTNNELCLYYQPKVNMRTGDVFGVEALIRWIHPKQGLIPPLDFLPLLDGTDLECQIGDWVINQALMQLDSWQQQNITLEISVNISSHHLQADRFVSQLDVALANFPSVNSKSLQLEILESSALGDQNTIRRILKDCQNTLGVNIALDDFGTSYSSLTHLRNLPVNTIKIDQTFIRDMLDDPNDYTIVDAVIGLANSFNREVIAEGVETTAHGLMLLINGCEQAQGSGIAKPMPANEVVEWLTYYTPNQDWIRCGNEHRTTKESKVKLFKLIISQWKDKFITNIQSSSEDIKHWPIMNIKHCHCSDWLKRAQQTQTFEQQWFDNLEKAHVKIHALADDLRGKYQHDHIELARDGLAELHTTFDDISKMLELEYPVVN
jgi:EAL domain-containing protein (putative c-di-GMP-specific phosphodiesterase class I)